MDPHRAERITEALREELSEIISYEMADPRVASASVTAVQVSPDMRHALVQVRFDRKEEAADGIAALMGARNFLRGEVARRLGLFRIPDLHFESDISTGPGDRMDHILKRVRRGRPRDAKE